MKQRHFKFVFFDIPFFAFVLLFGYLTINYLPSLPSSSANPFVFFEFITLHMAFLLFPGMLIGFFVILFIMNSASHAGRSSSRVPVLVPLFKYAFMLLFIAVISLPISFAAVYVYAFAHINYKIFEYNYGGGDKALLTSPQAIADAIAGAEDLKVVPLSADTYKKELLLLSMQKNGGFYESKILHSFPDILYQRSYIPKTPLAFVNNHLAINAFTRDTLAIISPALGEALIEHSTEKSLTKPLPTVEILGKNHYLLVRKKHIKGEIKQIDTVVTKIASSIASVSGYIETNEEAIARNQEIITKAEARKAKEPCKTPEKCKAKEERYAKMIEHANKNIAKAQVAMQKNQVVLGTSVTNKNALESIKSRIAATESFTNYELGLFTPPRTITMTIEGIDTIQAFDAYLATLIHEYFHYYTYVDDETKLDHFFEEALTEYFARMAYENYTGKKTDIGYQIGVRIITAMTKRIPERELLAIYYNKDQKALETVLDKTYGRNFYADNKEAFTMINQLPAAASVEVANLVMEQIGGNELAVKDTKKPAQFSIPAPDSNDTHPNNGQSTATLP